MIVATLPLLSLAGSGHEVEGWRKRSKYRPTDSSPGCPPPPRRLVPGGAIQRLFMAHRKRLITTIEEKPTVGGVQVAAGIVIGIRGVQSSSRNKPAAQNNEACQRAPPRTMRTTTPHITIASADANPMR